MSVLPFFIGASGGPDITELFATSLYTGTGAAQTITNGVDLADKGGLVWIKPRNQAFNHQFFDTDRGVNVTLSSNNTNAENIIGSSGLGSFNNNGFSLLSTTSYNTIGDTYASWTFRRAPKFFDVITFTHTNGVTSNIATGLTVDLGFATVKRLDSTSDWYTNHRSLTAGYNLRLNTTAAESNTAAYVSFSGSTLVFDSAAPSGDYVAYVWGHDDSDTGVIVNGSYTGNASTTGPIITTGWPVDWLLVKRVSNPDFWVLADTARGLDNYLRPNVSAAESTSSPAPFASTGTGFQVTNAAGQWNASGDLFIYTAIRAPS